MNLCSWPDEAGLLGPLSQYKSPTDIGYFFRASVVSILRARNMPSDFIHLPSYIRHLPHSGFPSSIFSYFINFNIFSRDQVPFGIGIVLLPSLSVVKHESGILAKISAGFTLRVRGIPYFSKIGSTLLKLSFD